MPQVITPAVLNAIFQSFSFIFNDALKGVTPTYSRIAMDVPSVASAENYGWLGQMPRMREWIGDRVIGALNSYGYQITNKTFETTIAVKREQIEDDVYGLFRPMFAEMGRSVALFPDELVFPLLQNGSTGACYDGQRFFDTNHPVLDANGAAQPVANVTAGAGPYWYLIDTTRAIKPFIYQKRRPFEFVSKTSEQTSDFVFQRNQFVYGVDGRCNAGYGLWQLAYASGAALTRTNFRAARTAMINLKSDFGRPLGVKPNLLVVPPALESTARDLMNSDFLAVDGVPGEAAMVGAAGVMANTDKGLCEVFMSPWLS